MVHAPEEMDRKQVKSIEDSLMDIWDLTNLPFKLFHLNRCLFKAFILPGSGYTIAKAHVVVIPQIRLMQVLFNYGISTFQIGFIFPGYSSPIFRHVKKS